MDTRGIREYLSRDWQAVRASKEMYWGDRIARLGRVEGFRVAEELRQQALHQHPAWPDPVSRREDLQHHVRLAQRLRRASSTRRA